MKYLLIQNNGQIDVMALALMGASTKRNQPDKIGWFGSGNKYSIATLLRLGIPFKIFSGETEIQVFTEKYSMGDNQFDKIYFQVGENKVETSLTIQMGPDWEPWFVIREIYCNALDEGGTQVVPMVSDLRGVEGKTRFYIGITTEIEPVITNWAGYFSYDRIDLVEELPGIKLYLPKGDGLRVYRRGVLIHYDKSENAVFDYDVTDAPINESRTLKDHWLFSYNLEKQLAEVATVDVAKRLLVGMNNYEIAKKSCFEATLNLRRGMHENKDTWVEAIKGFTFINSSVAGRYTEEQKLDNALILRSDLINGLVEVVDDSIERYGVPRSGMKYAFDNYTATEDELVLINTVVQYLKKAGFDKEYPIETVVFNNHNVKAATDGKTIFISKAALDQGIRFVVLCMLEEIAHIQSGLGDETRGFQTYLLERWFYCIEKIVGYTL